MIPAEVPSADADALKVRRNLINRLCTLDEEDAWQDFFETYWKLIYRVARKAGLTEQEAEEVVQETTLAVSKCISDHGDDPRGSSSFKNWLLHRTRWRIIEQVRKRLPDFAQLASPTDHTSTPALLDPIPDPESLELDLLWEKEWQKNLVDAAMERVKHRIKPEHYQIFYLSVVRNLGFKRITESLGVSLVEAFLVRHRVAVLVKKEVQLLERTKSD